MEINLSPAEQKHLSASAALNGFASPEEYASHLVSSAVQLDAFAALSADELQASVRSVQRGLDDVAAGRTKPAAEALDEIASKFDLPK